MPSLAPPPESRYPVNPMQNRLDFLLAVAVLCSPALAVGCGGGDGAMAGHKVAPGGYYVSGNVIYGSQGQPHVFHGLDRPSLEWSDGGEHLFLSDIQLMASWKPNVVRVGLNQDFWLQEPNQYPPVVDQLIQWLEAAGMDVILDLHWSDAGQLGVAPAQQVMADANSVTFWQEVAAAYKNDGRVIFELYNEPHDVSWDVWQNGGTVTDESGATFEAAGMQQLYDAVRGAGADHLVLIGGLVYAFDLSGVPDHRIKGYNIAYASHPYKVAKREPATWDASFGFLAATDPVILTEFGSFDCSTDYHTALLAYADQHAISWTAWAWYVNGCTFPSLIDDWNGTPNAAGAVVKNALAAY